MKAKQIAILLALTTMMIAGCGSNTKNADSQTEVSTSTETADETSSDETDTEETDSNSGETANEATDSQQEAADPGDGNYEDNFAVSHEAAVDFAEKIKSAVAAKDQEALADLVNYPVYIGFKDEGQTVDTKEDFMKLDASELFTDDLLNAVANADESEDVLSPSMAGFNLYSNDASASLTFSVQDGKLGVTGINY
jgi:predicted lipid-binding transport protein (Tim44 family)